tara:strand:+ start:65 stop:595 length:531 start_codon:yes stop_codon:yes gene_type:complete
MYNKKIEQTISDNLGSIIKNIEGRQKLLKQAMGKGYDKLSTKLKSELLSNLLEAAVEETIKDVYAPTKDSEADVVFTQFDDKPLEIKTTATTDSWRGGEFSKRPGDYLMVGWEEIGGELRLFMLLTYLTKKDWISSGSDNYYATNINLSKIVENIDYKVLIGDVEKKTKLYHMVKN